MHIITLGDIIRTTYECYNLKPKLDRSDLRFMLNKSTDTKKTGSFYWSESNDRTYTSLRTGGVRSKSSVYYATSEQDETINNILKDGRGWLDVFANHLKNDTGPNFKIRMNGELIQFIHDTIYDETIDINEEFRRFLKHPMIYNGVVLEKQECYWMRFCWLVLFSVFQNDRIMELEELWEISEDDRLDCKFNSPLEWSTYCSNGNAGGVFRIAADDDGTIDAYVNFSKHGHMTEMPEWGSIVIWLPNRPKDYREFEGRLKYEICASYGLNSVGVELQNSANEGGHKYFAPHGISEEWETHYIDFSKKNIPLNILKSFGAICFVFRSECFADSEYKAHFQLKNIVIEMN